MFTEEQLYKLNGKLLKTVVEKRKGSGGMELDYIPSWYAIQEANDIFGFGGWSTQVLKVDTIWSGERPTKHGPKPAVSVIAHVRLQVGSGDAMVVREDVGYGDGMDSDHGKAHELACKEAVSDAMKRCLRTFGNKFGNALYDPSREGVFDPRGATFDQCKAAGVRISSNAAKNEGIGDKLASLIDQASTKEDLDSRWEHIQDEYWMTLPLSWLNPLKDKYETKRESLADMEV